MSHREEREFPETEGYSGLAVLGSAIFGLLVAVALVWLASWFDEFYEQLFRVGPTVEGGGIGTDWVVGNTKAWLDFLVAITHAADVLMGLFILFMVFLHWASFRRLASQMGHPGRARNENVVADGGDPDGARTSAPDEGGDGE